LNMMLNKWLTNVSKVPISVEGGHSYDTTHSNSDEELIDQSVIRRLKSRKKKDGKSLMTKVVSIYLAQSSKLLEDLIVATKESDIEAIKSIVHALKSSSSNVGASALFSLCKEVEARCMLGEVNDSLIDKIHSTYSDVSDALSTILKEEDKIINPPPLS